MIDIGANEQVIDAKDHETKNANYSFSLTPNYKEIKWHATQ